MSGRPNSQNTARNMAETTALIFMAAAAPHNDAVRQGICLLEQVSNENWDGKLNEKPPAPCRRSFSRHFFSKRGNIGADQAEQRVLLLFGQRLHCALICLMNVGDQRVSIFCAFFCQLDRFNAAILRQLNIPAFIKG